jgi:hypothetical protein
MGSAPAAQVLPERVDPLRRPQDGAQQIHQEIREGEAEVGGERHERHAGGLMVEAGQEERARSVLEESWRLFSQVTEPAEMLRVYVWEGRMLARLGNREEAAHVLESVRRRQLLAEPSPAEAALV